MNEITPALIYWITRLDGITTATGLILFFGLFATVSAYVFGLVASFNEEDYIADPLFKFARRVLPVVVVAGLLNIFVPTKKDMAAIIVVPKIANSETVAELGDGIKTLAVEWLEELRPAAKKEETK